MILATGFLGSGTAGEIFCTSKHFILAVPLLPYATIFHRNPVYLRQFS
ncbi:hypothetical protein [Microseira wollei]|nr:hypothetical protein [Microseira wollei]